ncbi:hypothetical protein PWG15_33700 (plasmid) [Ensifer adhaerens]|uniref:hypothetical protein n=1 Tax=Ensifer adhaerens TaxID=106592 RepID=UPI0023A9196C|nr:hypothetical protein [Ensifer adhaerens]WDZ81860.1 hypothetical protein PWG15_33700 [Ensifer adhaerens]
MMDQTRDDSVEASQLTDTTREGTDRETAGSTNVQSYHLTRAAQLEALRTDVIRLRTELATIAAGSSRLAVLEANVAIQAVENKVRRHFVPALVMAGVVGYVWTAFVRPR